MNPRGKIPLLVESGYGGALPQQYRCPMRNATEAREPVLGGGPAPKPVKTNSSTLVGSGPTTPGTVESLHHRHPGLMGRKPG